ncbi:MAG: glycosyltransferase, partial [Thermoguttaceae bacterium]
LLSGKPVISYDIDGAKEVVLNNKTGFLVPPKSVDELADRIIELAQNEPLRRQMGETGRKLFAQQFDHHFMTKQIREVYEDVRR